MKNTTLASNVAAVLIIAGGALLTSVSVPAQAQTVETTTATTTSGGTITEFSPGAIVVRSETSAAPLRYSYSKTTTYVDEAGNPVSMETVKSGLPVEVYYTRVSGELVASKVIVKKTVVAAPAPPTEVIEKKTTTTTTIEK
ncbi:MAG: hypothetical protein JWO94_3418 [Verrucomicrobiaceae bacterium]|nr:hypothetical protein [Verrucomicrobiaceae bacterium]